MGYDQDLMSPETFAHEIERALLARGSDRSQLRADHGRPGPEMVLPPGRVPDLPDAVRERIAALPGGGSSILAHCGCGRTTQSFALVDCRDFPDGVVARIEAHERARLGEGYTWDGWACDGCWTAWIRDGLLMKSDWIELHGGPDELVEQFRGTPEDHRP